MNAQTRGSVEMITAMVISGTVGWFVIQSGEPAAAVVFWRCLFGALAMGVACALLGVFKRARLTRRQWGLAGLGGVALILNWVLLFSAYRHASIAIATVVYHTQPFMLVGLGVVVLRERFSKATLAWLLLAFVGLVLIVSGRVAGQAMSADYLSGVALALGSAFFYALAALVTKQLKAVPAPLIVLIQMLVGVVLLAPFANVSSAGQALPQWPYLVVIGVLHTGLMSTLLYSALQKIPTALAGALSFIYPIVAILVDWLAFAHPLSAVQVGGAMAILLAAAGMNAGWSLRRALVVKA